MSIVTINSDTVYTRASETAMCYGDARLTTNKGYWNQLQDSLAEPDGGSNSRTLADVKLK